MDRGGRVREGDLAFAAVLLGRADGAFEVTDVVERIKDADDVDAVFDGLLDELLDDVVGVMAVAQDVLTAEKHLQLGVLADFPRGAETFPGIFVEEAETGVESGAAPDLDRAVTDLVQLL